MVLILLNYIYIAKETIAIRNKFIKKISKIGILEELHGSEEIETYTYKFKMSIQLSSIF